MKTKYTKVGLLLLQVAALVVEYTLGWGIDNVVWVFVYLLCLYAALAGYIYIVRKDKHENVVSVIVLSVTVVILSIIPFIPVILIALFGYNHLMFFSIVIAAGLVTVSVLTYSRTKPIQIQLEHQKPCRGVLVQAICQT